MATSVSYSSIRRDQRRERRSLLPRLVARSAPQILLDEALAHEARFNEFVANGLLRVD